MYAKTDLLKLKSNDWQKTKKQKNKKKRKKLLFTFFERLLFNNWCRAIVLSRSLKSFAKEKEKERKRKVSEIFIPVFSINGCQMRFEKSLFQFDLLPIKLIRITDTQFTNFTLKFGEESRSR